MKGKQSTLRRLLAKPLMIAADRMFDGVPEIVCSGTHRQIGLTHGVEGRDRILSSIKTYTLLFQETARIDWPEARRRALRYLPAIETHAPHLVEEIRGIAEGAGVEFEDILALNVRSELALTNYSDGCTSIAQAKSGSVFVAQNWDWVAEAGECTLFLDIRPEDGTPRIQMLAEAGIVGKFGMNSKGVAICMNALRCGAVDYSQMPVHIAMRKVLECDSFEMAKSILDLRGLASCVNFVIADVSGAAATIECSPKGNTLIPLVDGTVCHTNHLYAPGLPTGIRDHPAKNSFSRLERIRVLSKGQSPSFSNIRSWLSDQVGAPTSICRWRPENAIGMERMETLSTIIIDVKALEMEISFRQPSLNPPVKKVRFG